MTNKLNLEMGARNNAKTKRDPYDFYATDPETIEALIKQLNKDNIELKQTIWECAAGNGHISKVLKKYGFSVLSTDIVQREYKLDAVADFLKETKKPHYVKTILTNPPYKYSLKFAQKALEILNNEDCLVLYLKDRFLEGERRYKKIFSIYPPKYVYAHVRRQKAAMQGDFKEYCTTSGTQFYIWVIWQKGYNGETTLRWIA